MYLILNISYFLFSLCFSAIIFILWLRIALRYVRLSRLHPASRLVHTLTDRIIHPIEKHVPSFTINTPYDWPCFSVLILVEVLKFLLLGAIFLGGLFPWTYIPLYVIADLIIQPCNFLFYAVLIYVLLQWFAPHQQHPVTDVIRLVTYPLLHWARKLVPIVSGFDFSPLLVMIILKLLSFIFRAILPIHIL